MFAFCRIKLFSAYTVAAGGALGELTYFNMLHACPVEECVPLPHIHVPTLTPVCTFAVQLTPRMQFVLG